MTIAFTHTVHASSILEGPDQAAAVVHGAFPDWLQGDLVRTAPAMYRQGGWAAQHWFDALGMFYAFSITGRTSVAFKQRINAGDYNRAALEGRTPFASFGTPNQRGVLRQIIQPIPISTDNANVNIVPMGDELVAMTETDRQLAIAFDTLETLGHVHYDDDLPSGMWMTAHPLLDVDRDLVVNVGTVAGPRPELVFYAHPPTSRRRRAFGRVRVSRIPYVHAFGLSPRKAALIAHPLDVNPLKFVWSNRFIEHYEWRPHAGTTIHLVDRWSGDVAQFETDTMFVFHVINTYDEPGATVLDVLAYPDGTILTEQMRTERLAERLPDLRPRPTRIRLSHADGRAAVTPLADVGFEFPTISYRRHAGRPYSVTWGASNQPIAGGATSQIVRTDVTTGHQQFFSDGAFVFGEPVFVATPAGTAEDQGVLLSVGTDARARTTKLVALRADDLDLVAEATLEVPVPLGFHGSFVRATRGTR
ncbi:MAG: carotenoid oxygenase family protein [Kofleriaceae bacterium]|nr:carotenoid oxygenase family protein [Kofleriaceae bacterium]